MKLFKYLWFEYFLTSTVIRQKGEPPNGGNKKSKHAKFSVKRTFLIPWYAHVSVRIRGLEMFVFPKIWRALFPSYLRFEIRFFYFISDDFFLTRKSVVENAWLHDSSAVQRLETAIQYMLHDVYFEPWSM